MMMPDKLLNIIIGVVIGKVIYYFYKTHKGHERNEEHEECEDKKQLFGVWIPDRCQNEKDS